MKTIASPTGRIEIAFKLDEEGRPHYSVRRGTQALLTDSPIGLVLDDGLLGKGMRILGERTEQRDETYAIVAGKARQGRDHHRELTISLEDPRGRPLDLIFRAYDEGAAVRYRLPRGGKILEERIEFSFAGDHRCWAMGLPHFASSFEAEFPELKIGQIAPGSLHGLPLVVDINGTYVAIGEANLGTHAGMYIEGRAGNGRSLMTRLSPQLDRATDACVDACPGHLSAWRYLTVADNAVGLVESTLPLSLSEPCALADTSWIRPGKVTWDWWCGPVAPGQPFQAGMNDDTFRHFIDFAADLQLEYCMIDGGWYVDGDVLRSQPELDVPKMVEYGRAKGVGILLWVHQAELRPKIDAAFDLYAKMGVKGVKVDFFDRNDVDSVAWVHEVVRKAAERRLLANLHGVFSPFGLERTYPNLMTMEGVMGAEYNKWSRRVTPQHNVTLPFTRMVAGPMDYTVGCFDNVTSERFEPRNLAPMVLGTRAHHLAMYILYQSALQMVSDYPDAIRGKPGSEFIRNVPAAWDETRGLLGEVGEFVVVARRKGSTWYLGAMTGSDARTLEVPLDFLAGEAEATTYADGPDAATEPKSLTVDRRPVKPTDTLRLELAPAGGFSAVLKAIK